MHIFLDESGAFVVPATPKPHVSCVAALAIPSVRLDTLCREFLTLRATWPGGQSEVKGSSLSETQVAQTIALVARLDGLLEICAVDAGRHSADGVAGAKEDQASKVRSSVTAAHHPNLVRQMADTADRLSRLPNQLVLQLFATIHVVTQILYHAPTYFAQRTPTDLSTFRWVLDRKDRCTTPYEVLWTQLVCPFLQAQSLREPFLRVETIDYSHMAGFRVSPDRFPHLQPEIEAQAAASGRRISDGLDVVKLVREGASFEDSATHPGLQVVDILASAFCRAMNARLAAEGWGLLGSLMISQARRPPVPFIEVAAGATEPTEVTGRQRRILEHLSRTSRPMLVPEIRMRGERKGARPFGDDEPRSR